jgi:hypothetical protein
VNIGPDEAQAIFASAKAKAHAKVKAKADYSAKAKEEDEPAEGEAISLEDFYAYMPTHGYIFVPTREMWAAASVNARIAPISCGGAALTATQWLDKNKPVEQMTWAPGFPMLISGKLVADGGWIDRRGVSQSLSAADN